MKWRWSINWLSVMSMPNLRNLTLHWGHGHKFKLKLVFFYSSTGGFLILGEPHPIFATPAPLHARCGATAAARRALQSGPRRLWRRPRVAYDAATTDGWLRAKGRPDVSGGSPHMGGTKTIGFSTEKCWMMLGGDGLVTLI